MARVTTRTQLQEYILAQLGAPIVKVEISEDQMNNIIDSTIQDFSNFALEGELIKYVKMTIDAPCVVTLADDVQGIQKISKGGGITFGGYGGAGFVLDYYSLVSGGININDAISSTVILSTQRSLLEKFFGDDLTYTFNPYKKELNISEPYHGNVLMEVATQYTPNETKDFIFDNSWIKAMSTARCKLLQSDITGKYDTNLVGGARINADRMQQRAEQEIQTLKEELLSKWCGPAPVLVG